MPIKTAKNDKTLLEKWAIVCEHIEAAVRRAHNRRRDKDNDELSG